MIYGRFIRIYHRIRISTNNFCSMCFQSFRYGMATI